MNRRIVLESAGASLLLLFCDYLPFFHPQNHDLYHHGLPVTNLAGGMMIDLAGVSCLCMAILLACRSVREPLNRAMAALFAGLMLWTIIDLVIRILFRLWLPVERWEQGWSRSVIVFLCMAVIAARVAPRQAMPVVRLIRMATAAVAFSALWVVPQLVRIALARPVAASARVAPESRAKTDGTEQRIIWILFDELSYRQAFESPGPGVDLPNFRKLRATSVSFSHIAPVGFYTDRIIPSLLSGKRFERFRSTLDGDLWYEDEARRAWVPYDRNGTLFALAEQNGWTTGIDGWYNAYCSSLAPMIDSCYWYPGVRLPLEEYGASENQSAWSNAVALPRQVLALVTGRKVTEEQAHRRVYDAIMARTQMLIEDQGLRFLFLHLAVPHPPGIYDRTRHQFRPGGTYLDNLVLADDTLGILMKDIAATPAAEHTTLLITSDHSWRTPIYKGRAGWTAEEEAASQGTFDDRPVLLVHFPGQETEREVSAQVPEMMEHDLIAGMLRNQIHGPDDVTRFVSKPR